jgi:hypothetical protein
MKRRFYIALGFDGTCVMNQFPDIGEEIGAAPVLKKLVDAGHELILCTMRSGDKLDAAIAWFKHHNIPLFGINTNPTQQSWTQSSKTYAHMYIDASALGCPLKHRDGYEPPFVDWRCVEDLLTEKGLLIKKE